MHFDPFCAKYTTFDLKKDIFYGTEESKFEQKMTFGFENDMRNLANVHQRTRIFQNWDFHWILLHKVENGWA